MHVNTGLLRPLFYLLPGLFAVVLSASSAFDQVGPTKDGPLLALAEKVREKRETTKIGGDVAVWLRLRDQEEEIPAYGQRVIDQERKRHAILVTEANDLIVIFGNASFAYFCLTDSSGKLRRVFRAEPGKEVTYPAVSTVQRTFEEQITFWKTYLGIAQ